MMRYSLVVCNGNRFQKELKGYSDIPGFKTNEKTLEGITEFTSKFTSLNALKYWLMDSGIITPSDWSKNLAIAEFGNGPYPCTLFFNLTFAEDRIFLNRDYLVKYYQNHIEDAKFMKEFYYQFHNNNWGNPLFRKVYLELEHQSTLDKDLKKRALLEMQRFIYEYSSYHNRIKGYFGTDFKRIKLLAGLAINYENRTNPKRKVKHSFNGEDIKLELQNLYALLRDNPTEEEKEAYTSRIKDIKEELATTQRLNMEAVATKRFKKARKDPYAK